MHSNGLRVLAASATLLFGALALTACAPKTESTSTAAPTVASAPTATPPATPAPVAPVVAFGGDCATVIPAERMSDAIGETMNFREPQWEDGSEAELGGVTCRFASHTYLSALATVWVYPVTVVDPEYIDSEAANSCKTYDNTCVISDVFGDAWVGASVYAQDAAQKIDGLRPVLEEIGARADAAPPPEPGPRAGWWMPTPTCDTLAASLSAAGVSATASDDRPSQIPSFTGGPIERGCTIDVTVGEDSWSARIVLRAGAGGGVESVLASDAEARIERDGRTFAAAGYQYPIDGGPGLLLGTDGVNLVELLRNHEMVNTELDERLLVAILDALAE